MQSSNRTNTDRAIVQCPSAAYVLPLVDGFIVVVAGAFCALGQ